MNMIAKFFAPKTTITSATIRARLTDAESEIAAHRAKIGSALAGVAAFSDSEHLKIEGEIAATERAITRLESLVAHLNAALPATIANEEEQRKAADDDKLRARAKAAAKASDVEARKLLEQYAALASQIADVFARLAEIDAETNDVNAALRLNPLAPTVANYSQTHRKAPDREASETKELRHVWTFGDGYSEPAFTNADGSVRAHDPHWGHQQEKFLSGTLVQREIIVGRTDFRPGVYLEDFSAVRLPPAFFGNDYYWPCKS